MYTAKISQLIRVSREQNYREGTADQLAGSVSRALIRKADTALLAQAGPTPPATPSHILVDPFGWAQLHKLKYATDSNQSLLGAGTVDAEPMLLSLPVIVNVAVPQLTGVVIDRSAVASAVGPVQVATSADAYFSTDDIGLRATWRIGQNIVRPDRVGVFGITGDGS